MSKGRIESVCIFGSSARASTDELSDRDILIVADDKYRRIQLTTLWRQRGWSVAVYSPSRLLRMIASGSLFIQHLKLEGVIVADKGGWLSDNLEKAKPKKSYIGDAMESVFLALPIERFDSNALIKNNLLAADLAYVAIRNFGICHLADKKNLFFDYGQIATCLGKDFSLSRRELKLLHSLRAGKVSYRESTECVLLKWTIGELRFVLSKLFVDRPLGQIDHDLPTRRLAGGYTMLRDFEAFIVAKLGRCPTESEVLEMGLEKVWKWIREPRAYAWNVRNISLNELNSPRFDYLSINTVAPHSHVNLPEVSWKLPDNTSLTRKPKFPLLKTGYSNSLVSTSPFSRHVGQKIV